MGLVHPITIVPPAVDPNTKMEDAIAFLLLSGRERERRSQKAPDRGFWVEGSKEDEDSPGFVLGPMQFLGEASRNPNPVFGFFSTGTSNETDTRKGTDASPPRGRFPPLPSFVLTLNHASSEGKKGPRRPKVPSIGFADIVGVSRSDEKTRIDSETQEGVERSPLHPLHGVFSEDRSLSRSQGKEGSMDEVRSCGMEGNGNGCWLSL